MRTITSASLQQHRSRLSSGVAGVQVNDVPPKTKEEWGKAIVSIRKAAQLTQAAFGFKVGANQVTVARWEKGRNVPDRTKVEAILRAFRLDTKVYSVAVALLSDPGGTVVVGDNTGGRYVTETDQARMVARELDKIGDEDVRVRAMTAALVAIEHARNPPAPDAEQHQGKPASGRPHNSAR